LKILGFWLLVGAVAWNAAFEVIVNRGVKDYLYQQARFELGRGPRPTIDRVVGGAVRDGAVQCTLWSAALVAAGILSTRSARRQSQAFPNRP
jgi:hypothetical protein